MPCQPTPPLHRPVPGYGPDLPRPYATGREGSYKMQIPIRSRYSTHSRTLKVRGGIIPQADRYLGGFCASQRIFPPQIIQVLLHAFDSFEMTCVGEALMI